MTNKNLPQLSRETYTGAKARPVQVLQFGAGNFLRGFVDWMIQQTNNAGLTNMNVAVAYATDRPNRKDTLVPQDGLYTVCLEGIQNGEPARKLEVIDVISEIVDPYRNWDEYQDIALSDDLRIIVSNTTEAGIDYVEEDLDQGVPHSFPGLMAKLLHDRFLKFKGQDVADLAVVPSELIDDNGQVLRSFVKKHVERHGWGEACWRWIEEHVHFYDSLVDRIVAGYPSEAQELWEEVGYQDCQDSSTWFRKNWGVQADAA